MSGFVPDKLSDSDSWLHTDRSHRRVFAIQLLAPSNDPMLRENRYRGPVQHLVNYLKRHLTS